jgi:hypothetical protein
MNIRKPRGALTPTQCRNLEHVWYEAKRLNRPLNRMLTIKPGGDLSSLGHAKLVDWTWNKLGGWSRYHAGGFYCVLTREKGHGGSEHFHALVHVPPRKAELFERTVRRWFGETADIDIRPADQTVRWSPSGKIRSAIGYLTKQRLPQAAWRTPYSRQAGGPVLGKRYRITRNLLSPAEVEVRPKSHEIGRAA